MTKLEKFGSYVLLVALTLVVMNVFITNPILGSLLSILLISIIINIIWHEVMHEDLKKSILELQLRETKLVEELDEIRLQIKFLHEQLKTLNDCDTNWNL